MSTDLRLEFKTELFKILQSKKPSLGISSLLEKTEYDVFTKEIKDMIDVQQNPQYHAEGDVYTHTMLVIDYIAANYTGNNKILLILSALCHDMGKITATRVEKDGELHSYGHEVQGVPIARQFIGRFLESQYWNYIEEMVLYHMKPNTYASSENFKKLIKLLRKVEDPEALVFLAYADSKGITKGFGEYVDYTKFFNRTLEQVKRGNEDDTFK